MEGNKNKHKWLIRASIVICEIAIFVPILHFYGKPWQLCTKERYQLNCIESNDWDKGKPALEPAGHIWCDKGVLHVDNVNFDSLALLNLNSCSATVSSSNRD